jgi:adenylate cyclase
VLSGRATPIEVWEPVPRMDAALRDRLVKLWLTYDAGDRAALAELGRLAIEHKDDAALANFVYRIREAGPGGHYVLGSK